MDFDILISKLQTLNIKPISHKYVKKQLPTSVSKHRKIAKSIQRPAQTKEQTKLITLGIQQGIDLYKRQQKEKARELNKQRKKTSQAERNGDWAA